MKSEGLGRYVSERRKLFAFSQSDLAKALGYTSQSLSKFEAGDSQISILVLPKLANLLNESLDDLLEQKENPAPLATPNGQVDNSLLTANLVALRTSKGISQAKQATLLGVSKRSIIHYEQGQSCLSLDALCRLCTAYKISAAHFFFDKIPATPLGQAQSLKPHRKGTGIWISLATLAGIALTVGCTSPLWLGSFRNTYLTSSSTIPLTSSSFSTSSTISSSSTASISSSSTTAATSSGDLSPYVPGLTDLIVERDVGDAGHTQVKVGSTFGIYVFAGSFLLNEASAATYGLSFYVDPALSGVSFSAGTHYDSRTVTLDSSFTVGTTFDIGARVYALAHPEIENAATAVPLQVTIVA
jgi:transcriptional regulator with XRE-family HTH domain